MLLRATLLSLLSLALVAAPSQAQCPTECTLSLPDTVAIGGTYDLCIEAPGGSVVFLMLSDGPGPTPSVAGPLSLDLPILWMTAFGVPAGSCGFCFPPHLVPCEPALVGFTAHFQFVAVDPQSPTEYCLSNAETMTVIDLGLCPPPGTFVTFTGTPGGWGAPCNGNNVGCLRDDHFADVFPNGIVLGDQDGPDGDGAYSLVFSSAAAVETFLPNGGGAAALTADATDPASSNAGVLAGHLLAATLNVAYDDAGVFDHLKPDPAVKLKDLVLADCVHASLIGRTVSELLELANGVLSGAQAPPGGASISAVADALAMLNEAFPEGSSGNSCFAFAAP